MAQRPLVAFRMVQSPGLLWFQRACRVYACVPLALGTTIALMGGAGLEFVFGADVGEPDPNLESAIRFLGANFAAMGLVLVWGTGDVVARRAVLRIVFGALIVGGALRLLSIALHGVPGIMTLAVIGGEFMACVLWLWHARILRQLHQSV